MNEPQELEETRCPLCSSGDSAVAYPRFAPYRVCRCLGCGAFYLSPRLTEAAMLSRYRDDGYYHDSESGYTDYETQEAALRATFRRFLAALEERGLTGGRLLEVGCGYGYLLAESQGYFSSRAGTDFSQGAVDHAKQHAEAVYQGGLDAIPREERFDCIVANQVIEHIYSPRDFVESLKELLAPGGRIVLTTPNMGALWRRLMGHRWPSFKLPEHVLFFDRYSLERLLRESGLEDVDSIPYPHAFPLRLVAEKLGLAVPAFLGRYSLWLPSTTIAAHGALGDG